VAISMIVYSGPSVIAVHPDVPAKNLAELIALAKAQPGKLSYAVDISSGLSVTSAKLFTKSAGIQMIEVPYKASSQAMADVTSGQVQAVVGSTVMIRTSASAGKVRRLAISSEKRFPGLDDLPTVSETLPGVHLDGFYVLVAPTGTPAAIVQRVNREMDMILKDPAISNRLLEFGLATNGAGTPESTEEFLRVERDRWGRVIKDLGIEKQ
jgi:tripartite-type tricarboxylate transporter receptor subunit TctC